MVWTLFWDMHSGGDLKEPPFSKIYIEAPEDEARRVFSARFGHNPERITCPCCGEDYSLSEYDSLEAATDYHRRGTFGRGEARSLEGYAQDDDVLIISAAEIKPEERTAEAPTQGWVWVE